MDSPTTYSSEQGPVWTNAFCIVSLASKSSKYDCGDPYTSNKFHFYNIDFNNEPKIYGYVIF